MLFIWIEDYTTVEFPWTNTGTVITAAFIRVSKYVVSKIVLTGQSVEDTASSKWQEVEGLTDERKKKKHGRGQIIWCERDQGVLHIDEGNVPQTVGSLGRNVFGTDLIGIQA